MSFCSIYSATFLRFLCFLLVMYCQLTKISPEAHRNLTLYFPLGAIVQYSANQCCNNFIEYNYHKWLKSTLHISIYVCICININIIFFFVHSFCFIQVAIFYHIKCFYQSFDGVWVCAHDKSRKLVSWLCSQIVCGINIDFELHFIPKPKCVNIPTVSFWLVRLPGNTSSKENTCLGLCIVIKLFI